MNDKKLKELNELKQEIEELNNFILVAEKVWTGKIIKQEVKYIFKSADYGIYNSIEFNMNTEIKNKVLDVLIEYLNELKTKFKSM